MQNFMATLTHLSCHENKPFLDKADNAIFLTGSQLSHFPSVNLIVFCEKSKTNETRGTISTISTIHLNFKFIWLSFLSECV